MVVTTTALIATPVVAEAAPPLHFVRVSGDADTRSAMTSLESDADDTELEPRMERIPGDDDEVESVDGSFVRGKVLEIRSGDAVVIEPARGGEVREIPWDEVAVVRRGEGGASAPAAQPSPSDARSSEPTVTVHLEIDKQRTGTLVQILDQATGTAYGSGGSTTVSVVRYRKECDSPCGAAILNHGQGFVVNGPRILPSRPFELPRTGEVVVDVKSRSKGFFWGGLAAGVAGAGLIVGGTAMYVRETVNDDRSAAPIALMTVGAVAIVGGTVMMFLKSRAKVRPGKR